MQFALTNSGKEDLAQSIEEGRNLALYKIYLCTETFTPESTEDLPPSSIIAYQSDCHAVISDNKVELEENINIATTTLIKNITISDYTSWDGEHTFAISNDDNGLLTLLGDSRNVLSIVLQITGIDNPPVVVMTNILYPLATDDFQGTVMLADMADILAKRATRESKPLVTSPDQLGSPLIDCWIGAISISQNASDNISALVYHSMQSSTASVTANNIDGELDFIFSKDAEIATVSSQTGIDYYPYYEITFYGADTKAVICEDANIIYADLRYIGLLPSSGEGSWSGYVKVAMYAFAVNSI